MDRSWLCGSGSGRGDGGAKALAHRFQSLAHLVQARGLVFCKSVKFFRVRGFSVLELVVNHSELFPALGEGAFTPLAETATLAGCLPLPEPERLALRPSL